MPARSFPDGEFSGGLANTSPLIKRKGTEKRITKLPHFCAILWCQLRKTNARDAYW
jgi:hypothetical protein